MVHSQKKGKRGEDQFCDWLKKHFKINVRREHFQASGCSADIIVDDFIFEIKRHEKPNLDSFWYQVSVAQQRHENNDLIPVVAFRKNREKWQFLLPAKLIGLDLGYIRLNEKTFINFAKTIIKTP